MPIYEYKCDNCSHQLEILQKINDEPPKFCPECGKEGLRKMVSAAAFKLKGTGWYETDFKDKKPKAETKKTNGASTATGTDSASKETKKETSSKSAETPKSSTKSSNAE